MCRSMHLYPFLLILPVISITEEWGGDDEERSRRGEKKGKQSAQRERKWKEAMKGGRRERGKEKLRGGGRNWKKLILPDLHLNHSHSCHGDADSSSSRCLTFLWPLPSNQGRTGEWDPQKREERGRGNPSLLQSSGGEMERSYTKKM